MPGGSDPEQLAVSLDGRWLFVANEDTAQTSVVDAADGRVIATVAVGAEPWKSASVRGGSQRRRMDVWSLPQMARLMTFRLSIRPRAPSWRA
jgi:YVTN family beta-propeller protein